MSLRNVIYSGRAAAIDYTSEEVHVIVWTLNIGIVHLKYMTY